MEDILKTMIHTDDKHMLRKKLTLLQKEYARTVHRLQRAERSDAVRKHVQNKIAEQKMFQQTESNLSPVSSTTEGRDVCPVGPSGSEAPHTGSCVRFCLSDSSPSIPPSHTPACVRQRRDSAHRLRSRKSRLRWAERDKTDSEDSQTGTNCSRDMLREDTEETNMSHTQGNHPLTSHASATTVPAVSASHSSATTVPAVSTSHASATTVPAVSTSHVSATTVPAVSTSHASATTVPAVSTSHASATTVPAVCTSHVSATTVPAVCTSHASATTVPAVSASHSSATTVPAVSTSHASATTVPAVSTSHSSATTVPAVSTSHASATTVPAVSASHASATTVPAVSASHASATTVPAVSASHVSATTVPAVSASHASATTVPAVCTSHVSATTVPAVSTSHASATTVPAVSASHVSATTVPAVSASHVSATTVPAVSASHASATTVPAVSTSHARATTVPAVSTSHASATTVPVDCTCHSTSTDAHTDTGHVSLHERCAEPACFTSCTLVEGLIFPVEYYVRTTRRMSLSQSRVDLAAVIQSQLCSRRKSVRKKSSRDDDFSATTADASSSFDCQSHPKQGLPGRGRGQNRRRGRCSSHSIPHTATLRRQRVCETAQELYPIFHKSTGKIRNMPQNGRPAGNASHTGPVGVPQTLSAAPHLRLCFDIKDFHLPDEEFGRLKLAKLCCEGSSFRASPLMCSTSTPQMGAQGHGLEVTNGSPPAAVENIQRKENEDEEVHLQTSRPDISDRPPPLITSLSPDTALPAIKAPSPAPPLCGSPSFPSLGVTPAQHPSPSNPPKSPVMSYMQLVSPGVDMSCSQNALHRQAECAELSDSIVASLVSHRTPDVIYSPSAGPHPARSPLGHQVIVNACSGSSPASSLGKIDENNVTSKSSQPDAISTVVDKNGSETVTEVQSEEPEEDSSCFPKELDVPQTHESVSANEKDLERYFTDSCWPAVDEALVNPVPQNLIQMQHKLKRPACSTLVDLCSVYSTRGWCVLAASESELSVWIQSDEGWSVLHTCTFTQPVIALLPVPETAALVCVTLGQLEVREIRVLSLSDCVSQHVLCVGHIQAVLGTHGSRVAVISSSVSAAQRVDVWTLQEDGRVEDLLALAPPTYYVNTLVCVDGQADALIGSDDSGRLLLWNMKTGHLLQSFALGERFSSTLCVRGFSHSGVLLVLLQYKSLSQDSGKLFSLIATNPVTAKHALVYNITQPTAVIGRLTDSDVFGSSLLLLFDSGSLCVWDLKHQHGTVCVCVCEEADIVRWAGHTTLLTGHINGDVCICSYTHTFNSLLNAGKLEFLHKHV